MTMKPPPPMPAENGSVTPNTAAAATAPSTALPPWRNVSIAACVARTSTVAAAPPVPTAVGGPDEGGLRRCADRRHQEHTHNQRDHPNPEPANSHVASFPSRWPTLPTAAAALHRGGSRVRSRRPAAARRR